MSSHPDKMGIDAELVSAWPIQDHGSDDNQSLATRAMAPGEGGLPASPIAAADPRRAGSAARAMTRQRQTATLPGPGPAEPTVRPASRAIASAGFLARGSG